MTQKSDIWDEVKNLSAPDKVSKAKITLNKEQPFFAYLVEHLLIREDTKGLLPPANQTMGVDGKGNCVYSKDFVLNLQQEELVGVLAHEVMHVANEHIMRRRERSLFVNGFELWNICIDIVTNQMLVENNFRLPTNALIPQNNQLEIFGGVIDKISDKAAEDIYEELKAQLKQMVKDGKATEVQQGQGQGDQDQDQGQDEGEQGQGQQQGQGKGQGFETNDGENPSGFDEHLKGDDKKGQGKGQGQDKGQDKGQNLGDQQGEGQGQGKNPIADGNKDWKKIMAEAVNHAKMRGKVPLGAQRMFEELHRHKINWRAYLRRVIASKIPFDVTYSRPNKKYQNQDIFMPSVVGEAIKVICSIDTSGSVSQGELEDYVSELLGIAKSFHHVDFYVITHDHAVHDYVKIFNGNVQKIKQIQIHGGGGTSHLPVYEFIRDKRLHRETKLLVSFTDGHSEYPERRPEVDTIFVLSGAHKPVENMPTWGTSICLD